MSYLIVMPTIWPAYRDECLAGMAPALREHLLIVDNSVGPNLGLAASWNLGVRRVLDERLDWLVILSAATRFGPAGGEDFIASLDGHAAAGACVVESSAPVNQHFFAVSRTTWETVGLMDPNFWPIYCDDGDICYRIYLAQQAGLLGSWANQPVDAWVTMAGHAHKLAGVRTDFVLGWSYFVAKWGGLSGEQTFTHPFDDPALPLSFWPVPPDPRSIIGKDGRPDELRAEWETTA